MSAPDDYIVINPDSVDSDDIEVGDEKIILQALKEKLFRVS